MITIGRLGTTIEVEEPEDADIDGDRLTVHLVLKAASVAQLTMLVQQANGLVDAWGDEPVVAVTSSAWPEINGFYSVDVAGTVIPAGGLATLDGIDCPVELVRVPGYTAPRIEELAVGGHRANDLSVTTGIVTPWSAVPAAAIDWHPGHALGAPFTRQGEFGDIQVNNGYPTGLARYVGSYSVAPEHHLDGAATLELDLDDSGVYHPVQGRQLPAGFAAADLWRLSNDGVRVSPSPDVPGRLRIECWGGDWESATDFALVGTDGITVTDDLNAFKSITATRVSPEETAVRLSMGSDGFTARQFLDLRLRRGARHVECRWTADDDRCAMVAVDTPAAATAVQGGLRRTGNDGDGNRWVLLTPHAKTNDTTNGTITLTAADSSMAFALGFEVGGSGAASGDAALDVSDQYFAPLYVTDRVVGGF